MKPNGWPLPGFLFSATEKRAREACAEERSECRAAVRAQMHYEMQISLVVPWLALGLAVLGRLMWGRVQEKKKAKARLLARSHHDPGKFRKLDRDDDERVKTDDDDDNNL